MKICLIAVEIFAWGKYGGFGRATRTIGRELAKRGFEVFAVVPRRPGQKHVEDLDGIRVLGFSPWSPWDATPLFRHCDADIYHSCEPSVGTYLAFKAMPHKRHVVTVRDPRDLHDWWMEFKLPSLNRLQVLHNYFYENNFLVRRCIRQMNAVFTTGKFLVPKVKSMYRLELDPAFLPTPVTVPKSVRKSEKPTVCYVGRLDRRKQPQLFFDLAERFPHIRFIAMGKSRDRKWEDHILAEYSRFPNLKMTGFVDQFSSRRHSKILEESWVMVNTATREGLPNAFLEAAAHKCAILSFVDPDGFASLFGYHVRDGDLAGGLTFLLENDRWKERGERGCAYVRDTFELRRAIDLHIAAYESALS